MRLFITLLILSSQLCFASKSKELAQKGELFYEAFECHHIALDAGEKNESIRLFNVGMREGKIFIDSARKGLIKKEDANENVPMVVLWNLNGQSTDFILGTLYKEAQDTAIKDIHGTKEEYYERYFDKAYIRMMARSELDKRNAWLIK
jgi:hypothetical protein